MQRTGQRIHALPQLLVAKSIIAIPYSQAVGIHRPGPG
jgi:hypothetical protein